jgi:hypothetical protein
MPAMKAWTKSRSVAAVLSAMVWLSGCGGPHTAAELRNRPACIYSFDAPADCKTVYMRIVGRTRQRYVMLGTMPHQPGISATLQPDGESASISLWDGGRIGFRYILSAQLRQTEPERTAVEVYCTSRADRKEALLWEAWANTPFEK